MVKQYTAEELKQIVAQFLHSLSTEGKLDEELREYFEPLEPVDLEYL